VSRIIDPLTSRCAKFRFGRLHDDSIMGKLKEIAAGEKLDYDENVLRAVIQVSKGDMRKAVGALQSAAQLFGTDVTPEGIIDLAGQVPTSRVETLWKSLGGDMGELVSGLQFASTPPVTPICIHTSSDSSLSLLLSGHTHICSYLARAVFCPFCVLHLFYTQRAGVSMSCTVQ
jgi:hypothetical protein